MDLINWDINRSALYQEIENQIQENQFLIKKIKSQNGGFNELIIPLQKSEAKLSLNWSIAEHLQSVDNKKEWREKHLDVMMQLTDFTTRIGQDRELMLLMKNIKNSESNLSSDEALLLDRSLINFKLMGVELSDRDKEVYLSLSQRLNELSEKFSNNTLDSTDAWFHGCEESSLEGLSDIQKNYFKEQAKIKNAKNSYALTIDGPGYQIIMSSLKRRDLRELAYKAYTQKAGPYDMVDKKYDNSEIAKEILEVRNKLSKILGYKNFRELSLANRFASNEDEVTTFIDKLLKTVRYKAIDDHGELTEYALTHDNISSIEPWDLQYYSEKTKKALYEYDEESLKSFFPLDYTKNQMFSIFGNLYNFTITEINNASVWHPDVKAYLIAEQGSDKPIGVFYTDLLARSGKRSGAWMGHIQSRAEHNEWNELPVVYLVCNFEKNNEITLTMRDVETLFHEFGHSLHHLLTYRTLPAISGLNQVPWDIVELPSQLQEQWCYDKENLKKISKHIITQKPIDDGLIDKILQSKNHMSGIFLNRQLEFAGFDWSIHNEEKVSDVVAYWKEYRKPISIMDSGEKNSFPLSFNHIFSGGYAAGYYSYLWAEAYSHQVYEKIKDNNYSQEIGEKFIYYFLGKGGDLHLKESLHTFLGEEQNISPLLRAYGLIA